MSLYKLSVFHFLRLEESKKGHTKKALSIFKVYRLKIFHKRFLLKKHKIHFKYILKSILLI